MQEAGTAVNSNDPGTKYLDTAEFERHRDAVGIPPPGGDVNDIDWIDSSTPIRIESEVKAGLARPTNVWQHGRASTGRRLVIMARLGVVTTIGMIVGMLVALAILSAEMKVSHLLGCASVEREARSTRLERVEKVAPRFGLGTPRLVRASKRIEPTISRS